MNHNELVPVEYAKSIYNAAKHPAVIEGKRTEQDALQEFLETFDTNHEFFVGKTKNLYSTREEFFYYYAIVSSYVEEDKAFEKIINNAWNLRGTKPRIVEGGKQDPYLRSGTESRESPFSGQKRKDLAVAKKTCYIQIQGKMIILQLEHL